MIPNWPWTLNNKYSVGAKTCLCSWNFGLLVFCSTTTCFRDNKVARNQKCTEWPQTEHFTVKTTLYTLNTYPWARNFGPFRSTISHFRGTCTGSVNSEMLQITPNWTWKLTVKSTLCVLNTYLWGPNFGPFSSTISPFQDTTYTRSAKTGNASNNPKRNLNT